MRRFAVISDIHSNATALGAVLADIATCGIEEVYCLGDLVGYGPDPMAVIRMIRDTGIPTVRGNYDDGIGLRKGECGCYYPTEQARSDGEASYRFTDAAVDAEAAAWLAALPDSIRLDIGGRRVLLSHGSPRKINEYLHTERSDEQLVRIAENAGADVVFVGHTHVPFHRRLASHGSTVDFVNVGSVGKPKDGDPRACWCEATFADLSSGSDATHAEMTDTSLTVTFHRVAYDIASVQHAMREAGLPQTLSNALQTA